MPGEQPKKFNPGQRAVALQYKPGDAAPRVLAKGTGFIAEKILENAQAGKIPIYKDPALAESLTALNLGDNIPPELYEVVAQVLIFICDLDKREEYRRNAPKG